VLTAAHLFDQYTSTSKVEAYRPGHLMEPVVRVRACLVAKSEREDLAIVQIDRPANFSTVSACPALPVLHEEVEVARPSLDHGIFVGVVTTRASFIGVQGIPKYPSRSAVGRLSGRTRYAFEGLAELGMSGGGAYALDGQCVCGVVSLVDPRANDGAPITFVAAPSEFGKLMPSGTEMIGERPSSVNRVHVTFQPSMWHPSALLPR